MDHCSSAPCIGGLGETSLTTLVALECESSVLFDSSFTVSSEASISLHLSSSEDCVLSLIILESANSG